MTVFVAHAPADHEAAEALEKFLERRGQFVELDDGQAALRPVQQSDVVVLLLSKDFAFAPARLRLEQRALDAWTDQRLVVVKLDHAIAPVGLRDLPAIDANFEAHRDFKWQAVADAVRDRLKVAPPVATTEAEKAQPKANKRSRAPWRSVLGVASILGALGAASGVIYALVSPSYYCRLVEPDFFARLRVPSIRCINMNESNLAGVSDIVLSGWAAVAIGAGVLIAFALLAWAAFSRRRPLAATARAPASGQAPELEKTDTVFVSYARANAKQVLPVIEAATAQGRTFWIDQQGIGAGQGWAGEIVRAIKTAEGVVVMCSQAAFESDHVKREIYLADRYRKKLTPVFIEHAEPPEDFEYFFAGVQQLRLFETPEAERPEALMRALGAAA